MQSLYDEQDLKDFYVTGAGDKIDHNILTEYSRRFFEDRRGGEGILNLWDARTVFSVQGTRQFSSNILSYAREITPYLEHREVNVIDRLGRRHKPNSEHYADAVRRLLDFGQPWLAETKHFIDRDRTMANAKREHWIALQKRASSDAHDQFWESLSQHSDVLFTEAECSPDTVYVTCEMTGFPLIALPDLDLYRDRSYVPRLQNREALHTEILYEKFQDLLIKRPEDVDTHLSSLEILVRGILSGVIRGRVDSDKSAKPANNQVRYTYVFFDNSGLFPTETDIGPFSLALRRLSQENREDLRENINKQFSRWFSYLEPIDIARWYYLLRAHADRCPVPQAGLSIVLNAEAETLLRQDSRVEEEARAEEAGLSRWSVENPPGSGFRSLVPSSGSRV